MGFGRRSAAPDQSRGRAAAGRVNEAPPPGTRAPRTPPRARACPHNPSSPPPCLLSPYLCRGNLGVRPSCSVRGRWKTTEVRTRRFLVCVFFLTVLAALAALALASSGLSGKRERRRWCERRARKESERRQQVASVRSGPRSSQFGPAARAHPCDADPGLQPVDSVSTLSMHHHGLVGRERTLGAGGRRRERRRRRAGRSEPPAADLDNGQGSPTGTQFRRVRGRQE